MINRVIYEGFTVRDPEFKEFDDGCVANFSIGCDRPYTAPNGDKLVDFLLIVARNDLARSVMQYNRQGRRVLIEGRTQVRHYGEGADRKFITECIASYVRYLDDKVPDQGNANNNDGRDSHPGQYEGQNGQHTQNQLQTGYAQPRENGQGAPTRQRSNGWNNRNQGNGSASNNGGNGNRNYGNNNGSSRSGSGNPPATGTGGNTGNRNYSSNTSSGSSSGGNTGNRNYSRNNGGYSNNRQPAPYA